MRLTRPDDYVVSYARTKISNYGIVSGLPVDASRPKALRKANQNWSNDGWLVPVSWYKVEPPLERENFINQIEGALPDSYSPINRSTGYRNQCAHLCKINKRLFDKLKRLGILKSKECATSGEIPDVEKIIDEIEDHIQEDILKALKETEAETSIRARKGQGTFRRNVELVETCCRVTGLKDKRLLIASHIKPWRVCETFNERLDGSNGLLLAPHVDHLFDKGLISFKRSGKLIVSGSLDDDAKECLGLTNALMENVGVFSMAQEQYLDYHRKNVFVP